MGAQKEASGYSPSCRPLSCVVFTVCVGGVLSCEGLYSLSRNAEREGK